MSTDVDPARAKLKQSLPARKVQAAQEQLVDRSIGYASNLIFKLLAAQMVFKNSFLSFVQPKSSRPRAAGVP
jgi:hypothetical protein